MRALFDDQVHDSRAWFLYASLDTREPWGSYFLYRMIYFGELMSKSVTPLVKFWRVMDAEFKDQAPGASFLIERIERGGPFIGNESSPGVKQKISVVNSTDNMPLTMSSELPSQPALTNESAELIARQQQLHEEEKLANTKAAIAAIWS